MGMDERLGRVLDGAAIQTRSVHRSHRAMSVGFKSREARATAGANAARESVCNASVRAIPSHGTRSVVNSAVNTSMSRLKR